MKFEPVPNQHDILCLQENRDSGAAYLDYLGAKAPGLFDVLDAAASGFISSHEGILPIDVRPLPANEAELTAFGIGVLIHEKTDGRNFLAEVRRHNFMNPCPNMDQITLVMGDRMHDFSPDSYAPKALTLPTEDTMRALGGLWLPRVKGDPVHHVIQRGPQLPEVEEA